MQDNYFSYIFATEIRNKILKHLKMKSIYAKDIKVIVKKFNLNEDEEWYLKDIASDINRSKKLCIELAEDLKYASSNKDKISAINAILVYFGGKIQKENDLRMQLNETTWKMAELLKCSSYEIGKWLKNISMIKDRFGKYVECSTTYGLNYLEIEL